MELEIAIERAFDRKLPAPEQRRALRAIAVGATEPPAELAMRRGALLEIGRREKGNP